VCFYGATAKEANEKKIAALADQNRGVMFADPKGLKVAEYLPSWLSDTPSLPPANASTMLYPQKAAA
jgi:hypothetical protein